jgi:hypothetical protein
MRFVWLDRDVSDATLLDEAEVFSTDWSDVPGPLPAESVAALPPRTCGERMGFDSIWLVLRAKVALFADVIRMRVPVRRSKSCGEWATRPGRMPGERQLC